MRAVYPCLVALLLAGCESNDDAPQAEDVSMVVDHSVVSMPLVSVYPMVRAMRTGQLPWDSLSAHTCAVVDSIAGDTSAFPNGGPVTVYLRYPAGGCMDVDGRMREGDLILTFEDDPGTGPGTFTALSNTLIVTGSKVRFALKSTASGASQTIELDSCHLWSGGAWSLRTEGLFTYQMTAGSTTNNHDDDSYTVTRSLNGFDRNGRAYSVSTSTPLAYGLDCPWVVQGKEIVIPIGLGQRIVDHGLGTCDGYSAIILNGDTIGLTIP